MNNFVYKCFLIGTTAIAGIGNVNAADCMLSDCNAMGFHQNEAACHGYKSLLCPFDLSKYFCSTDVCDDIFQYDCSGTGYKEGYGYACNNKYIQCYCADGYEWTDGSCKKIIPYIWTFNYRADYILVIDANSCNGGCGGILTRGTVQIPVMLQKADGAFIKSVSITLPMDTKKLTEITALASDLESGEYKILFGDVSVSGVGEAWRNACRVTHASFDGVCYNTDYAKDTYGTPWCGSGSNYITNDAISISVTKDYAQLAQNHVLTVYVKCGDALGGTYSTWN